MISNHFSNVARVGTFEIFAHDLIMIMLYKKCKAKENVPNMADGMEHAGRLLIKFL